MQKLSTNCIGKIVHNTPKTFFAKKERAVLYLNHVGVFCFKNNLKKNVLS